MSDHDISRGDVFKTPAGPIKVKGIQTCGDLMVTDPTVSHPQDARAGRWTIERSLFEDDLESGDIERASLEVV